MKEMTARSKPERKRVAAPFTADELVRIDNWGFARSIRDRSEAIRALVEIGLDEKRASTEAKFGRRASADAEEAANRKEGEITTSKLQEPADDGI